MFTLLEGIAIIQLNTPTFLTVSTLYMMSTLRFAVTSSIYFGYTTAETKLWLKRIGQWGPLDY